MRRGKPLLSGSKMERNTTRGFPLLVAVKMKGKAMRRGGGTPPVAVQNGKTGRETPPVVFKTKGNAMRGETPPITFKRKRKMTRRGGSPPVVFKTKGKIMRRVFPSSSHLLFLPGGWG